MKKTDAKKLYDFIDIAQDMKIQRRATVLKNGKTESIADHTYLAVMLAELILETSELKLDKDKVIKMILIHDLPEAITGDYHSYKVHSGELSRTEKKEREAQAIQKYLAVLPETQAKTLESLWREYEDQNSTEAKFAKAIDRLETMIQWASMDFEFYHDGHDYMGTYGNKEISNFLELYPLWSEMKLRLKGIFEEQGIEWKKEYELN